MTGMTRGRLPARVYWVRRAAVLGIAFLLVVGIARMLGGSSDGSGGDTARNVADTGQSTSADTSETSSAPATTGSGHGKKKNKKADDPTTPVVMPSGPCEASDVAITPSVPKPVAGGDINLVLDISSLNIPACTWTLSGKTTALKITSGNDLIWTSSECPKALSSQDLVLRQSDPTRVKIVWDARRSEPGCPVRTEWALPGTYHLHVAALAGQPQDVSFLLTAPSPAEVTRTAHPHQHAGHHHRHKKHRKGSSQPD
jgi:hypothetical protein